MLCRVVTQAFEQARRSTLTSASQPMGAVRAITNLCAYMHKSPVLTSLFYSYQEEHVPGNHDSILRCLEIRGRFMQWLEDDTRLMEADQDTLEQKNVAEEDLDSLRALCYVLYGVKLNSLAAEDPKAANGILYVRAVESIV